MLLDKGKISLQAHTQRWRRKSPKSIEEGHQMRWRNRRMMVGPKLSAYILMLPILQSQIFNLLTNIFVGQRSIFISVCLACIVTLERPCSNAWEVDGSYHLTDFYAVEMFILLPNWCSLFKVIDLVKLELFYKLGKWLAFSLILPPP